MSGQELEFWVNRTTLATDCVMVFRVTNVSFTSGCPSCDWGFDFDPSDGSLAGGDCAALGYAEGASSFRGRQRYGVAGADPMSKELWRHNGSQWEQAGTLSLGGDPTDACDLTWALPQP